MGLTRGFTGRGEHARDPRLPPGQYDVGDDWPELSAELTPHVDLKARSLTVTGAVEREVEWTWEEIHALFAARFDGDIHGAATWSELGTSFTGVSVGSLLDAARPLPTAAGRDTRRRILPHGLHDRPSARRPRRRAGARRVRARGPATSRGARRSGAPCRAAPVLLEEREVALGAAPGRPRRAGLVGARPLPRSRGSLAGAAVPG